MAKFASFLLGKGPADVLAPSRLFLYQDQYVVSTGAPVHLKMTVRGQLCKHRVSMGMAWGSCRFGGVDTLPRDMAGQ
jgi:hypothetical protein